MGIAPRQIGWSNESNLLWDILKKLDRLTGVTSSSTQCLLAANIIVPGTGAVSSLRCGANNIAAGSYSTSFGSCNSALGNFSTIAGGQCNSAGSSDIIWPITSSTYSGIYANTFSGYFAVSCWAANGSSVAVCGDYSSCSVYLPATLNAVYYTTGTYSNYESGSGVYGCNISSITYDAISDTTTFSFSGNLSPTSYTVLGNDKSFVGNGHCNNSCGIASFIGNGCCNASMSTMAATISGFCNFTQSNYSFIGNGVRNVNQSSYGFIGNGDCNCVQVQRSFIGNGQCNFAENYSSVINGIRNTASGYLNFIGGGTINITSNRRSTILNGICNYVSTDSSFIGGGSTNYLQGGACADYFKFSNVILGGVGGNTFGGVINFFTKEFTTPPSSVQVINNSYTLIGNGCQNAICLEGSTVLNGICNHAFGYQSVILNGECNKVCLDRGFIGSGFRNTAVGSYGLIVGGNNNTLCASGFVGIGFGNTSSQGASFFGSPNCSTVSGSFGFIGAGCLNTVSNCYSVIVNGLQNGVSGRFSFIGGGQDNINGGIYSSIITGRSNIICTGSAYSSILGGFGNTILASSSCSFIIGSNIVANRTCTTFMNNLSLMNLPTSSTGLPVGAVWRNGNVLNIV